MIAIAAAAALAGCMPGGATRQTGDADQRELGRSVAERECGLCHQVTLTESSVIEAAAPAFMEIANLPGRNRNYLRQFMTERHDVTTAGDPPRPMPTVFLEPPEREAVIVYLLTFQRDPRTGNLPPTKLEPFE